MQMLTQTLKRLKIPIQLKRPHIPVSVDTKSNESEDRKSYEVSKINRVRRLPERASYDRALVHSILDTAMFINVCFVDVIDNEVRSYCIIILASCFCFIISTFFFFSYSCLFVAPFSLLGSPEGDSHALRSRW
jgi:hypothetical protein